MRASRITAHRQQCEQAEQQCRDQVLAEFGGDSRAMADEIVRLRNGLSLLAEAVDWVQKSAPVALVRPGPYWRPRAAGVSLCESDEENRHEYRIAGRPHRRA